MLARIGAKARAEKPTHPIHRPTKSAGCVEPRSHRCAGAMLIFAVLLQFLRKLTRVVPMSLLSCFTHLRHQLVGRGRIDVSPCLAASSTSQASIGGELILDSFLKRWWDMMIRRKKFSSSGMVTSHEVPTGHPSLTSCSGLSRALVHSYHHVNRLSEPFILLSQP